MGARVLETERLYLRQLRRDDAPLLLRIFADPLAMRYYPGTKDAAQTRGWIEWNLDLYGRLGHGMWAAFRSLDDCFVGQAGLVEQELDGEAVTEVGYLLLREHWGRGFASEAARACRDYGFQKLGRERLVSFIDPRNAASRRVAERIGMHLEREVEKWGKPVCVYAVKRPTGAAPRPRS